MTALSLGLVACGPGEAPEEQHLASVEQKAMQTVGPLQIARAQHCSMRLPDGKVLFVGGFINTSIEVTATTEVYDPGTRTTSFRAPMNVARRSHECLTLQDGSLLVLGGVANGSAIASVEKYNPSTNSWALLAPMPARNWGMAVAQLADGRVLVAGGTSADASAYLFDPSANSWMRTGSLSFGRTSAAAVKLPDNRVLAVGGFTSNDNRRALEVYTPSTGTWSVLAPLLQDSPTPIATLLPDGRVFVGTSNELSRGLVAQVYTPSSNTWTLLPRSNSPHDMGRLALVNGQPIVVGGGFGVPMPFEQFDFAQQRWTTLGQLSIPRHGFTLDVLTDGSLLVAGGYQANTQYTYTTMDLLTFDTLPPPGTSPLTYSASNTNSAQQNTTNRTFTLNAGDMLKVGTCGVPGSSASGDTYLRLFGGGFQVFGNDDNCGSTASFIQYTAATTGTYELRAGCFSSGSCSGTVTFSITPAKL
ncbi:WD40 repeat domain protein [Cystobacter fuscus DSM 2262]|uniref:WD40 repeat domain protein n=2 Tax=Cystobacter fuscus TaxID=43 RepID=S9R1M9_CYSF2|nr:WD40 repeat domain protein [Cystobacter fuscus DSM 2262]